MLKMMTMKVLGQSAEMFSPGRRLTKMRTTVAGGMKTAPTATLSVSAAARRVKFKRQGRGLEGMVGDVVETTGTGRLYNDILFEQIRVQ
jgi:hypothetical protein